MNPLNTGSGPLHLPLPMTPQQGSPGNAAFDVAQVASVVTAVMQTLRGEEKRLSGDDVAIQRMKTLKQAGHPIAVPPAFTGTKKGGTGEWLRQWRVFFLKWRTDEKEKVSWATGVFQKDVERWWNVLVEYWASNNLSAMEDWDSFEATMLERFPDRHVGTDCHLQLEKLAQGPKETVTSYISRFERIVHTEGFSITEDTKVYNFLKGLTVQARERVTLSGADSLKEMQTAALKMDVDWGSSLANRTQGGPSNEPFMGAMPMEINALKAENLRLKKQWNERKNEERSRGDGQGDMEVLRAIKAYREVVGVA